MAFIVNEDCRFFRGDKPCRFKRLCEGCSDYKPIDKRILIIKTAALGDVLRTTPLLIELKRIYPSSFITWVTSSSAMPLLYNIEEIDEILPINEKNYIYLIARRFDLLICLDKENECISLANQVSASTKKGFGMNSYGRVGILNPEAEYAFRLGLDDNLKFFENKKTYQEIIFGMCGYDWHKEPYIFSFTGVEEKYKKYLTDKILTGIKRPLIGINPGAGEAFANKNWSPVLYTKLINKIDKNSIGTIALLGGIRDKLILDYIKKNISGKFIVFDPEYRQSLREFAAQVSLCDVIVTGDTLAMHISLALRRKTIVLFGSTCHSEIEYYNVGYPIITSIDCAPCYKSSCEKSSNCMTVISPEAVYDKLLEILK